MLPMNALKKSKKDQQKKRNEYYFNWLNFDLVVLLISQITTLELVGADANWDSICGEKEDDDDKK